MVKKDLKEFGWTMVIDTDAISSVGGLFYDSSTGKHDFQATIGGNSQTFTAKAQGFIFKSIDPDLEKLRNFF